MIPACAANSYSCARPTSERCSACLRGRSRLHSSGRSDWCIPTYLYVAGTEYYDRNFQRYRGGYVFDYATQAYNGCTAATCGCTGKYWCADATQSAGMRIQFNNGQKRWELFPVAGQRNEAYTGDTVGERLNLKMEWIEHASPNSRGWTNEGFSINAVTKYDLPRMISTMFFYDQNVGIGCNASHCEGCDSLACQQQHMCAWSKDNDKCMKGVRTKNFCHCDDVWTYEADADFVFYGCHHNSKEMTQRWCATIEQPCTGSNNTNQRPSMLNAKTAKYTWRIGKGNVDYDYDTLPSYYMDDCEWSSKDDEAEGRYNKISNHRSRISTYPAYRSMGGSYPNYTPVDHTEVWGKFGGLLLSGRKAAMDSCDNTWYCIAIEEYEAGKFFMVHWGGYGNGGNPSTWDYSNSATHWKPANGYNIYTKTTWHFQDITSGHYIELATDTVPAVIVSIVPMNNRPAQAAFLSPGGFDPQGWNSNHYYSGPTMIWNSGAGCNDVQCYGCTTQRACTHSRPSNAKSCKWHPDLHVCSADYNVDNCMFGRKEACYYTNGGTCAQAAALNSVDGPAIPPPLRDTHPSFAAGIPSGSYFATSTSHRGCAYCDPYKNMNTPTSAHNKPCPHPHRCHNSNTCYNGNCIYGGYKCTYCERCYNEDIGCEFVQNSYNCHVGRFPLGVGGYYSGGRVDGGSCGCSIDNFCWPISQVNPRNMCQRASQISTYGADHWDDFDPGKMCTGSWINDNTLNCEAIAVGDTFPSTCNTGGVCYNGKCYKQPYYLAACGYIPQDTCKGNRYDLFTEWRPKTKRVCNGTRTEVDACDLPEWCNGVQTGCPAANNRTKPIIFKDKDENNKVGARLEFTHEDWKHDIHPQRNSAFVYTKNNKRMEARISDVMVLCGPLTYDFYALPARCPQTGWPDGERAKKLNVMEDTFHIAVGFYDGHIFHGSTSTNQRVGGEYQQLNEFKSWDNKKTVASGSITWDTAIPDGAYGSIAAIIKNMDGDKELMCSEAIVDASPPAYAAVTNFTLSAKPYTVIHEPIYEDPRCIEQSCSVRLAFGMELNKLNDEVIQMFYDEHSFLSYYIVSVWNSAGKMLAQKVVPDEHDDGYKQLQEVLEFDPIANGNIVTGRVRAYNRANLYTELSWNFVVDDTPARIGYQAYICTDEAQIFCPYEYYASPIQQWHTQTVLTDRKDEGECFARAQNKKDHVKICFADDGAGNKKGFYDPDSGIMKIKAQVEKRMGFEGRWNLEKSWDEIGVDANFKWGEKGNYVTPADYTINGLSMQDGLFYRVAFNVTNGAGESILYYTQPVLCDSYRPTPGYLSFRNPDLRQYEHQAFYYPYLNLEHKAKFQANDDMITLVWEQVTDRQSGDFVYFRDDESDSGERSDYVYWGIDHFEWAIGTKSYSDDPAKAVDLKRFTWVPPNQWRETAKGLYTKMQDGQKYYATLCAYNPADAYICESDFITIDLTPPTWDVCANPPCHVVREYDLSPDQDVDGFSAPTALSFFWGGVVDLQSGIQGMSICIGYRDHGPPDSLLPFQWMNVADRTTIQIDAIKLYNIPVFHVWYKATVRTWNQAGLWLDDWSDGFMIDDNLHSNVGEGAIYGKNSAEYYNYGWAGQPGAPADMAGRGLVSETDGWVFDGPFEGHDIQFQGNEIYYENDDLELKTQEESVTFHSQWGFSSGLWNRTYFIKWGIRNRNSGSFTLKPQDLGYTPDFAWKSRARIQIVRDHVYEGVVQCFDYSGAIIAELVSNGVLMVPKPTPGVVTASMQAGGKFTVSWTNWSPSNAIVRYNWTIHYGSTTQDVTDLYMDFQGTGRISNYAEYDMSVMPPLGKYGVATVCAIFSNGGIGTEGHITEPINGPGGTGTPYVSTGDTYTGADGTKLKDKNDPKYLKDTGSYNWEKGWVQGLSQGHLEGRTYGYIESWYSCAKSQPEGIDITPPNTGFIQYGRWETSEVVQASQTEVFVQWHSFDDPESGIQFFEVCLGTSAASFDNIFACKNVGIVNFYLITGLTLSSGSSYYATVRATNWAQYSAKTTGASILIDTTGPTGGTITYPKYYYDDGAVIDATWTGIEDPESGLKFQSYALGSSVGGTQFQGFQPMPAGEGVVSKTGSFRLPLINPFMTYYVTMVSENGVGLTSVLEDKTGVYFDDSGPMQGEFKFIKKDEFDHQNDEHTLYRNTLTGVIVQFSGWHDSQSPIVSYQMYGGTTPGPNGGTADVFGMYDVTGKVGQEINIDAKLSSYTATGYIYITLRSTNKPGKFSEKYVTILIDKTAPTKGTVVDATSTLNGTDLICSTDVTQLVYNWTASTDGETGIAYYESGVGTSAGSYNWLPLVKSQGRDSLWHKHITTGAKTLVGGTTYFAYVRATNWVGLTTSWFSDGVLIQTKPPLAGKVYINQKGGITADDHVRWTSDTSKISAFWTDWQLTQGGSYVTYQWAIGWNEHGYQVQNLTEVGQSTSQQRDMTLLHAHSYYITVQGVNCGGLHSTAVSEVMYVDTTPPEFGELMCHHESETETDATIHHEGIITCTFSAADYDSYMVEWRVSPLHPRKEGLGWDEMSNPKGLGLAGHPNDTLSTANDEGLNRTFDIADWPDGIYYFTVGVINVAGVKDTITTTVPITIDKTPPIPAPRASDTVNLEKPFFQMTALRHEESHICQPMADKLFGKWIDFNDPQTGLDHYEWAVVLNTTYPFTNDSLVADWYDVGMKTRTELSIKLTDGETYYSCIRAHGKQKPTPLISEMFCSEPIQVIMKYPAMPAKEDIQVSTLIPNLENGTEPGTMYARARYTPDNTYYRMDWKNTSGNNPYTMYANYTWGYDSVVWMDSKNMIRTTNDAQDNFGYAPNLDLLHGVTYYGHVEAENCCGFSTRRMTQPLTIDLTPPVLGDITVRWFDQPKIIQFSFDEYYDHESGVEEFEYALKTYWGEYVINTTTLGKEKQINATACVLSYKELERCYGVAPSTSPTSGPTRSPSTAPSMSPSFSPTTSAPSISPTVRPTLSPTQKPTLSPSLAPTRGTDTWAPTDGPSVSPTLSPTTRSPTTANPSTSPSKSPTLNPTVNPSTTPTVSPSRSPSTSPTTKAPTPDGKTNNPSVSPTTMNPTVSPTTRNPSVSPTTNPSVSPTTRNPSTTPTLSPSTNPTPAPTFGPTYHTMVPSFSPTATPSVSPTAWFEPGLPITSVTDKDVFSDEVTFSSSRGRGRRLLQSAGDNLVASVNANTKGNVTDPMAAFKENGCCIGATFIFGPTSYVVRTTAVNGAGLVNENSKTFLMDLTHPEQGLVYEADYYNQHDHAGFNLRRDLECQKTNTDFFARWEHAYDLESDIAQYYWSVGNGTLPEQRESELGFVDRGLQLNGFTPHLNMERGKIYYATVKFYNGVGKWAYMHSNGVRIVQSYPDNLNVRALQMVHGIARITKVKGDQYIGETMGFDLEYDVSEHMSFATELGDAVLYQGQLATVLMIDHTLGIFKIMIKRWRQVKTVLIKDTRPLPLGGEYVPLAVHPYLEPDGDFHHEFTGQSAMMSVRWNPVSDPDGSWIRYEWGLSSSAGGFQIYGPVGVEQPNVMKQKFSERTEPFTAPENWKRYDAYHCPTVNDEYGILEVIDEKRLKEETCFKACRGMFNCTGYLFNDRLHKCDLFGPDCTRVKSGCTGCEDTFIVKKYIDFGKYQSVANQTITNSTVPPAKFCTNHFNKGNVQNEPFEITQNGYNAEPLDLGNATYAHQVFMTKATLFGSQIAEADGVPAVFYKYPAEFGGVSNELAQDWFSIAINGKPYAKIVIVRVYVKDGRAWAVKIGKMRHPVLGKVLRYSAGYLPTEAEALKILAQPTDDWTKQYIECDYVNLRLKEPEYSVSEKPFMEEAANDFIGYNYTEAGNFDEYIVRDYKFVADYNGTDIVESAVDLKLKHRGEVYISLTAINCVGHATMNSKMVKVDLTPPKNSTASIRARNQVNGPMPYYSPIVELHERYADNTIDPLMVTYQTINDTITVDWQGFEDMESGVEFYLVGIGTFYDVDDVVPFERLYPKKNGLNWKKWEDLYLEDGQPYFVSVLAVNKAGLNSSVYSVIVPDASPPEKGVVWDGFVQEYDIDCQSEFTAVGGSWKYFKDDHSGPLTYEWAAGLEPYGEDFQNFTSITSQRAALKEGLSSLSIDDTVYFTLRATNKALLQTTVVSDGVRVICDASGCSCEEGVSCLC